MTGRAAETSAKAGATSDAGQVRSVLRAGRIVTTLAEHPYPMGIVELAERMQLSPGSVHRLLATLLAIGWVEQNARTAKYRLGTRIMGIGATGLVSNPVVQDGKTFLARLAEWTGHDALLSTLVGMRTVHLARVAGTLSRLVEFEPGRSQPAHAMADGKLLLAYLPQDERRRLYEVEGLHRYTPNTIVAPAALERELARIRKQGYAVDDYERFESGRGVAVPVLGTNRLPILAMLCVGELDPDPKQQRALVSRMLSLASEMAEHLSIIGDMPGQVRESLAARRP
jgi:DNA-binding IclR family transcriptional regulator